MMILKMMILKMISKVMLIEHTVDVCRYPFQIVIVLTRLTFSNYNFSDEDFLGIYFADDDDGGERKVAAVLQFIEHCTIAHLHNECRW